MCRAGVFARERARNRNVAARLVKVHDSRNGSTTPKGVERVCNERGPRSAAAGRTPSLPLVCMSLPSNSAPPHPPRTYVTSRLHQLLDLVKL